MKTRRKRGNGLLDPSSIPTATAEDGKHQDRNGMGSRAMATMRMPISQAEKQGPMLLSESTA